MAKKKVHVARKSASKSSKKKAHSKQGSRTKTTGSPAKAAAVELLHWTHSFVEKCIATTPADKLTFQASPYDNHLIWTIGHLATGYSWFASLIDGKAASLPANFDKVFGMASKPVADAAAYPSFDEVKRYYAAAYKRFTDAISATSAKDLEKPTVAESHGFAKNRLDVVYKAAWHEGWHTGQLSTLRRAMGLPGLM